MRSNVEDPGLVFGVIGDLHMRGPEDEEAVRQALAALRAQGVAAVVVTGDLISGGAGFDRFLPFAHAWNAVFPPDCGVECLVVLGERDIAGGDVAEAWRTAFGEVYAPREVREIGGCCFVLCREPDASVGTGSQEVNHAEQKLGLFHSGATFSAHCSRSRICPTSSPS